MMTLGFYFTLTENSNCAKAAADGNVRAVVLNFIKKFQFPNMRTSAAFNESKQDGIKLAPMRTIVKLLYMMNLLHGSLVAHLSKEEIKFFIFYNEDVAKKKNPDMGKLIADILEYRKTGQFPSSVSTNENEHEWKHEDRQIREMLKVLQWSGCITEIDGRYVIDNDGLSKQNKADVYDIITCDTFWEGNTIDSYRAYMDIADFDMEIEVDEEDLEERNRRLFRYWLGLQVKPEDDSDAGNPYSESTIDRYVKNVGETPYSAMPDKSMFYTIKDSEVSATIEVLDRAENKDSVQISALRKYAEYVRTLVAEKDIEEIFKHSLFGIHIKEKNDALSEEHPHVCIGWSAMGDLSDIDSKDALSVRYDEHFDKIGIGRGQDIGQVWRFINDVKVGDYIIFAENSEFHIGRIESDYFYDASDNPNQSADYKSTRTVRWLKKNISRSVLSSDLHNSLKTAMSIWAINDYKSAVAELLRGTYQKDEERTEVEETVELKFKTDLEIPYERNRIVFGAPGTGKSHKLKEDCEKAIDQFGGSFERVTFHPDYSYSQFVGTYKPVMGNDGSIRYDFVPGPFMRVYVDALKSGLTNNPQPYLLIIEEINRAKVAAVFGDVFQLLDRDDDGVSEYEIQASEDIRRYLAKEFDASPDSFKKIRIPNNMFIWSTMNSADQGVFPMDTAFKRRWNFEYLGIDENAEKIAGIGKIILEGADETIEWNRLRKAINAKMSSSEFKINEDKLMGPFFLSKKAIASNENGMIIDKKAFIDAFKSKVIMYLYEDAVKQGKHRFFDGCPDTGKYSAVCDAFDKIGTKIFGATFREDFYDKED